MFNYIIQTIVFQLIFVIAYDLFHKKDTFFTVNRIYLLITSFISLVLPLIKIKSIQETIPDNYVENLSAVFITNETASEELLETTNTIFHFLTINWMLAIYSIGICITSFLFVKRIFSIYSLKKNSKVLSVNNQSIILLSDSNDAFTFWNTIYIGSKLSDKEKEQVIAHELVHQKDKHSLDLLWFEICKIFFWFNPLVYIYQSRIILIHEYIADHKSIQLINKQSYLEQLLNHSFKTQKIQFINQFFNQSLIKKRIIMLQKRQSKSIAKFKYIAIIPLLIAMITLTAFSEKTISLNSRNAGKYFSEKYSKENKSITENNIFQIDSTKNEVPFFEIDKVPTTKACKNLTDQNAIKKCVSNEIKNIVNRNFNTKFGEELGLIGVNRIYVKFKIDTTGKIVDIESRGPHAKLEEEARRVVGLVPQMIPGEHDGQKVSVLYSLPIVFQINSDNSLEKKVIDKPSYRDVTPLIENLSGIGDTTVEKGYYLITNIFKTEEYFKRGMTNLTKQGLYPKWFKNPKDSYKYVYLEKYDILEKAKKMVMNDFDGKYKNHLYILKIQ